MNIVGLLLIFDIISYDFSIPQKFHKQISSRDKHWFIQLFSSVRWFIFNIRIYYSASQIFFFLLINNIDAHKMFLCVE